MFISGKDYVAVEYVQFEFGVHGLYYHFKCSLRCEVRFLLVLLICNCTTASNQLVGFLLYFLR